MPLLYLLVPLMTLSLSALGYRFRVFSVGNVTVISRCAVLVRSLAIPEGIIGKGGFHICCQIAQRPETIGSALGGCLICKCIISSCISAHYWIHSYLAVPRSPSEATG